MLELRLLKGDDIPLVESWLNKKHVKKWYEVPHMGVTLDAWLYEVKERNGEFKWITYLIAMWQDQPIGFCQYYKCEDSTHEDFGNLPLTGSYSIDYMIGEEAYLGKGLGKGIITKLVEKIFSFEGAQHVTADIDKNNIASEKSLLSCGFVLVDAESSCYAIEKRKAKRNMYDKMNANTIPSKDDLISIVISDDNNALLKDLCRYIETEFNPKVQIDYSTCSMAPGWNLKYKQSSKSICTIYPYENYFTVLITLNFDALELFNMLADNFSMYIRDLAANSSGMNGTKWFSVNVTDKAIADDVKKLLKLKTGTKKR